MSCATRFAEKTGRLRSTISIRAIRPAAWAAAALMVFAPAGILRASMTWDLQPADINLGSITYALASATALDFAIVDGPNQGTTGFITSTENPAEASASFSLGRASGHGHALSTYDLSNGNLTLHLYGSSNAAGSWTSGGLTAEGLGLGDALFNAVTDFGQDVVSVHVVGTVHREDDHDPQYPPQIGPFIGINAVGGYYQLPLTGNGTLNYDFYVPPFAGWFGFGVDANSYQPLTLDHDGSYASSASYDFTLTIMPVPEPPTFGLAALASAGLGFVVWRCGRQPGKFKSQKP